MKLLLPVVREKLFSGLVSSCWSGVSGCDPREVEEEVGEIGEVDVGISSMASPNLTGHLSSRECLTEVHPIDSRISAPWEVFEIKHKA